ncbi:MAG: hypothetical protein ACLF0G_10570 [Candidatus Brocadiia bacterium]
MDLPTGQAIKNIMGSIKGKLSADDYEKLAPLLSDLIALLERAHEDERRQLKAERTALDKDREAVNLARRSLEREREALAQERENIQREKTLAQRWRDLEKGLADAADAT